jgi:excinuclease UvrABC nuclease subunit
MYQKTLSKLESKVKSLKKLDQSKKDELLAIIDTLDSEIEKLSAEDDESAESIANFAQTSTHEAAKNNTNRDLIETAISGLSKSIEGFEASHPQLTETVNKLTVFLSNMGI